MKDMAGSSDDRVHPDGSGGPAGPADPGDLGDTGALGALETLGALGAGGRPGDPTGPGDGDDGDAIVAFWELARRRVGLGRLGVIVGPTPTDSLPPAAWAFGDSPGLADALLALVLAGTKTATASAAWEYAEGAEPLPQVGDLSIILDGSGHPRALVRTTGVRVVRFSDVDAEHAWLEGEGDRTLATWRAEHAAAFGRGLAAREEPAADEGADAAAAAADADAEAAADAAAAADSGPAGREPFDESMDVVLERFELRFPRRPRRSSPLPVDHIPR